MFKGHPKGLYVAFFANMGERFGYYTMLAIFLLYIQSKFGWTTTQAGHVYGIFLFGIYFLPLLGGIISDNFLGYGKTILLGIIVMITGYILLALPGTGEYFIYLALAVISLGTGLFKGNLQALVGNMYDDPKYSKLRDSAFNLFYMGINLGAFFGQLMCGYLGENVGWRWGFSVAAVGMFCGLVQFKLTHKHVANIGERVLHPGQNVRREWTLLLLSLAGVAVLVVLGVAGILQIDAIRFAHSTAWFIAGVALLYFLWAFFLAGLDAVEKKRMVVILVLFLASAMFWAGFEQVGSSFSIFAERFTIRKFGALEVPASWIQALNPLCVIALAPLVAMLWSRMARTDKSPSLTTKMSWALLMLALGFVVAGWAAHRALSTGPVWPTWLMSVVVLHTLGELFLSPVGLSAVTKLSPTRLTGQMMGIWFLGSSLGDILAGILAGGVTGDATAQMPERFFHVAITAGISGVVLLILARWITRLMPGIK